MPRLRLHPLNKYPYKTVITIRYSDLNHGGHLGNDCLLTFINEARIAFLKDHGFSELDFGGVSLIMGDTTILYQREAFAGDVIQVEVAAGEQASCGFRLFFRVTLEKDGTGIALVENGIVCFNYETRKVEQLPDSTHHIFQR